MDKANLIISIIVVLCIAAAVAAYGIINNQDAVFSDLASMDSGSGNGGNGIGNNTTHNGTSTSSSGSGSGGSSSGGNGAGSGSGSGSGGSGIGYSEKCTSGCILRSDPAEPCFYHTGRTELRSRSGCRRIINTKSR